MRTCPFCNSSLNPNSTSCQVCGYSLVSLLPVQKLTRRWLYLGISLLSLLLALTACVFTFLPSLYMKSLIPMIASLGLSGLTLEKVRGKSGCSIIRVLAVMGLVFAFLGYVSFMFIRSNVPGCGYSM
jgi:hypothetical protein